MEILRVGVGPPNLVHLHGKWYMAFMDIIYLDFK